MDPTTTANANAAAQTVQNANAAQAATQTGTQNASAQTTPQQQLIMGQMFSALLSKFMSVASENANNQ